jgi:hypothetical protein
LRCTGQSVFWRTDGLPGGGYIMEYFMKDGPRSKMLTIVD